MSKPAYWTTARAAQEFGTTEGEVRAAVENGDLEHAAWAVTPAGEPDTLLFDPADVMAWRDRSAWARDDA